MLHVCSMAVRQAGLNLVQYIAIRGDLIDKWPLGAIIAQACHASSAVLHIFKDDATTQQYLEDLDRMHKVVLRVKNNNQEVSCILDLAFLTTLGWHRR